MGVRIIQPITAVSEVTAAVTTLDAYDSTTDHVFDIRGMRDKALVVKNTGLSNGITYTVLGSVDDGVEYDFTVKSDTAVSANTFGTYRDTAYYTHWKVRVKSTVARTHGTSVSDAAPATSISAGNIQINIDGDGIRTVALGANVTGAAIAADIQAKVRAMTAATPANQAAYSSFTAVYSTVYTLTSGSLGTSSTVVVSDGLTNDVAATLKLGEANGGVEVTGSDSSSTAVFKLASISI